MHVAPGVSALHVCAGEAATKEASTAALWQKAHRCAERACHAHLRRLWLHLHGHDSFRGPRPKLPLPAVQRTEEALCDVQCRDRQAGRHKPGLALLSMLSSCLCMQTGACNFGVHHIALAVSNVCILHACKMSGEDHACFACVLALLERKPLDGTDLHHNIDGEMLATHRYVAAYIFTQELAVQDLSTILTVTLGLAGVGVLAVLGFSL